MSTPTDAELVARALLHNEASWWYQAGIRGWMMDNVIYLIRYTRSGWPLDHGVIDMVWTEAEDIRPLLEGEVGLMLMKRDQRKVIGEERTQVTEDKWAKDYPHLWEFITSSRYPDGSAREPASLLVFVQDGRIKGMLRDKDQSLCLWASAGGMADLFTTMELMVSDPETEWREDRQAPGQKAKRRTRGG